MVKIVWNELGGLSHGSFFRVSDSIDTSKPPGMNVSSPPDSLKETIRKILIGEAFFYSPNVTWFLLAVGAWCIYPYNLESTNNSRSLTDALMERLAINTGLAFTYIAFWHWILYIKKICQRPFVSNRTYNISKVIHNIYYSLLGILQWTVVEGAFIYLYRGGTLPYINTTSDYRSLAHTFLLSIAMPTFRDVHFYFAHRLIHVRCLYKYIHSLHHRNSDIEPFAGLAMHPVEHMYYFSAYGPLLVLPMAFPKTMALSPFLVFWMGVHLVISPAASHSGYEDHFSADLFHYLHHRYYECNYSAGINFDVYFGTYRKTLKDTTMINRYKQSLAKYPPSSNNTKENDNVDNAPIPPPPADSSSSLGYPEHPAYEFGIYYLTIGSLIAYHKEIITSPYMVAIVISFGPLLWAIVLSAKTAPQSMPWRKIYLAPFHKDSMTSFVLHLGLGIILAVLPVTCLLSLVLDSI